MIFQIFAAISRKYALEQRVNQSAIATSQRVSQSVMNTWNDPFISSTVKVYVILISIFF